MVPPTGLEPALLGLEDRCISCYATGAYILVRRQGLEPWKDVGLKPTAFASFAISAFIGTPGGTWTRMIYGRQILNLLRLPIPPRKHLIGEPEETWTLTPGLKVRYAANYITDPNDLVCKSVFVKS